MVRQGRVTSKAREARREAELNAGPAPCGTGTARTLFAALYGEFSQHPRPGAGSPTQDADAYSLFYARSAAMGWLTPAVGGAPGGLWGMNDAVAGPAPGPPPARVASFQVVLTGPSPGNTLPVQPFLSCAGDVLARLGALRLEALQLLLPEPAPPAGLVTSPAGLRVALSLLEAASWFSDGDPGSREPVRVTLAGADPSIHAAVAAIVQETGAIGQDVFVCDSLDPDDEEHLVLQPIPVENGLSTMHRVTFRGTLSEWSLDALGWLAAFLADLSSRQGLSIPLIFTAGRSVRRG